MTDPSLILVLTPGGLENGGGIGRLVGYMASSWADRPRPPMQVVDTRGPKMLLAWPFFMTATIVRIVAAAPRRPLLHIHLAAKGSTLRKVILVAVGRLLRLKMVLHLHEPDYGAFFLCLPRPAQRVVRWTFRSAQRVVVLGEAAKTAMVEVVGVEPTRVEIVPNAVPAPAEIVPGVEGDEPVILFLGHLIHRKGVHDLIAALATPALQGLRWRAILAGGGPDQRAFEAQAAASGIRARLDFPGWVDQGEARRLLLRAQILVLPSYAEGMAMSVLEGLAYGRCVVATAVGGLAEVLEDEKNALVVTPGDVAGLVTALARCLSDGALRARLTAGARETYFSRYDAAAYPDRIMRVFRAALDAE